MSVLETKKVIGKLLEKARDRYRRYSRWNRELKQGDGF